MNDNTSVSASLRALTNSAERLLAEQLRPIGITVPQMEFLAIFAANPNYSGADAARDAHVTPQTGSTVMQNLTARHLIAAKRKKGGGHRYTVTVTKAGTETLARAQEAVADVEKQLRTLLGAEVASLIPATTVALQPHLPYPKKPETSPRRTKRTQPKTAKTRTKALSAGAEKLNSRSRQWVSAMSDDGILPGYVALQFGTQTQINQLVTAGRWKPDGNDYRIDK